MPILFFSFRHSYK